MKYRTKRIYFGPEGRETSIYWTVKVAGAQKAVTLNGNILHALKGYAGVTVGCGLSNMAIDKSNTEAFPHPVYLASFTKSTALIVDKLKADGSPAHAVLYAHSYGWVTDYNDSGTLKKMVADDPSLMERPFTLRPPRKHRGDNRAPPQGGAQATAKSHVQFVPRGALARAVKAGRIGKNVAKQLSDIAAA